MKVLLINGSPNAKGCTFTALSEMAFLIKSISLGKEKYGLPEKEKWIVTSFIR